MAYIGNGPGVSSQRIVSEFEPTTNTTSFTPSSGYTVGYVDVYLNGIKLQNGTDFTASNGTSVVLTDAAVSGDLVEIVAYIPRGLSDGYTKAEADARYYTQSQVDSAISAIDLTAFNSPVQLKNYTTTQRNALTGLESGDTIYNSTTGSIEFYDGTNWIATNLIPSINSVSGNIYSGASSTLTLSLVNATDTIDVKYYEGVTLLATDAGVTVTSGSVSSTVPSAVYTQAAGDTISIQIFNTDGTPSSNIVNKTVTALPTGGTITTSGSYRIHTFTSSGTFTNTIASLSAEYLVVAGGGGGGGGEATNGYGGGGGGGGAGGLLASTTSLAATSYTVTVGGGGATGQVGGPTGGTNGTAGSNSSALGVTAIGGGYGANQENYAGGSGGSGGGAGGDSGSLGAGAGTSGQGYAGGQNASRNGGGGGGASAAGNYYNGGNGLASSISGSSVTYAGGGGGGQGNGNTVIGSGGAGGGGRGGITPGSSASYQGWGGEESGTANTGGGGGAKAAGRSDDARGAGGSGIVIVRYQL